jgi:hypothetical protein
MPSTLWRSSQLASFGGTIVTSGVITAPGSRAVGQESLT